jgi:hypothetical protein
MVFTRRWLLLTVLLILPAACSLTTTTETKSTAVPTDTAVQRMPIVHYYFASIPGNTFPAGSVVIVPDVLILSPTLSGIPRSADTAVNVQSAVQAMINDPRNVWTGSATITSVTVDDTGHAAIVLSGEIKGVGDAVLIAARMQFLFTVFAESSVQTATITISGQNIGNLGISHSSEAKPADYAYTRAEVETFMAQNAYQG